MCLSFIEKKFVLVLILGLSSLTAMTAVCWGQDTQETQDAPDEQAQQNAPVMADTAALAKSSKPVILDTLEIQDMDINDVLKLIASKSGLNIIAGKSITGRVTIFLQNVEVHDALMIILKANDLAYMENDGVVQIMTSAEYQAATGHPFGVTTQSTIVTLHSMKASDVAAILNQVKSQAGKVIPDDASNSIIIQDVPEKVSQLLEFIKTMDVPTSMKVYNLQFIAGDPLVSKIQEMLSPKIGYVKFDSLSNKLFIKDRPDKLAEIMKYIEQIDIPRETRVFNINYAKADDLAKTIGPMLTKDVGSIQYDVRSNTLVVTDIPPKVDAIEAMISALDRDDKEVFIDAKIVQITLGNDYQMGVDWNKVFLKTGNTHINFSSAFPLAGNPTTNVGSAAVGTLTSGSFQDIVQALDTFGKSRTLSNPHLAVINNQEANILIGQNTPYTTSTTTASTTEPVTSESVNFVDTGVKLHVTPTIHEDGFITMKIKPEISDISSFFVDHSNGDNQIPIVETSQVETTVKVKDGVTIVIGGLMKDVLSNTKNKIPVLGDLPFLGKGFSNEERNLQKTEIVIFLTPHIINGDSKVDPEEYIKETPSLKGKKIYYDPLPEDDSTVLDRSYQ